MRKLLIVMAALMLTACAHVPGKYSAPSASDAHAVITVENHLNESVKKQVKGWHIPGMAELAGGYKTSLFQIDGNKITKVGGVQQVRVTPGEHQVRVMVDDGLIPLSGDVKGNFAAGHTYSVEVFHADKNKKDKNRYQAKLVDQANASDVIDTVRF